MYSDPTQNDFNIYTDWLENPEHVPTHIAFEHEETDEHVDLEVIPPNDLSELASRMMMLLSAVTIITVGLVWLLFGGFRSENRTEIAQISAREIYPTPTLIGPGLLRAGGGALARATEPPIEPQATSVPTATPLPIPQITPIPPPAYNFNPGIEVFKPYVSDKMRNDLQAIIDTDFPARNYLATHLELTDLTPPEPNSPVAWQLGERRMINVVGDQVEMRLVAAGSTAYIWVDSRLSIPDSQFSSVVSRLDGDLYPAVTSLFGKERKPGIDADPRFHIFHLARLESRELGYFDSSDAYPKEVFAESNEHEAIYINMDTITLGGDVYYGTLVHELQHLIQWHIDRNETTWLDEGMSQLSEVYTGFNSFSVDDYIQHNHIQLNNWSYENEGLYSHYGGSALFVVYLWEQFGDDFIRQIAANRYDGMAAVINALEQTQSARNQGIKTVFRDWLIAVYLNDEEQAESKYGFSRYEFESPIAHQVALANNTTAFSDLQNRPQFSGWYVELPSNQAVTVSFAGDSVQSLFTPPPTNIDGSAGTVFFAPPRNRVDATLQKNVNLSGISNPVINFDAWFDMEEGYDYAYLMVSADNGQSWEFLFTPEMKQGTYGTGFSGMSAGWISQSASLDRWAGQQIIVQFRVLTDSAVPANGFAVDNIQISGELSAESFEANDGGWAPQGFVRTGNLIPQEWTVSIVEELASGEIKVTDLKIDRYGEYQDTHQISENGTLIIAPISPFTTQTADFWFSIE